MDEKKRKESQGTTVHDPINVDDDDDSKDGDNDCSLPDRKKSRLDSDVMQAPSGSGSLSSRSAKCPIKLMATQGDMRTRQAHWEENSNRKHWSYSECWTLREMLGFDQNPHDDYYSTRESIDWLMISNFIVDFDFLLQELPELISIPSVVVVYGHADDPSVMDTWKKQAKSNHTKLDFLCRDPSQPRRSSSNPLEVSIPYGCHHAKLFLIGYASGRLRVVIHTTNLRHADVHWKCQGAFIQDFFLKQPHDEFTTSAFEETLISYLSTYRYLDRNVWHPTSSDTEPCSLMDQLCKYDFSTAKGVLIPSAPGFHSTTTATGMTCGYLAVRKAINAFVSRGSTSSTVGARSGSLVCQFSSIGSLSEKYLKTLWEAWNVTRSGLPRFELVYPTHQEIVQSVEGIRGGGSVPGTCKNVEKPFLQSLWYKWNSSSSTSTPLNHNMAKGRNVPHIKTYYQVADEELQGKSMHWFMLGSHNLSKAAWGEVQNGARGSIFKVFHWELGIFVAPQTLGVDFLVPFGCRDLPIPLSKTAPCNGGIQPTICEIPLPYSFRPERYTSTDQPWAVDRF